MARKHREEGGGESWLNTYADMVTLLLTFFVMLFSMSSVKEEKWEAILQSFNSPNKSTDQVVLAPQGEGENTSTNQGEYDTPTSNKEGDELPANFNDLYDYLKAYVEQNNMSASVEVSQGDGSVYIRLSNSIIFNPDSYELRRDSYPVLSFLGDCLKNVEDELLVVNIDGHTAAAQYEDYPVNDRRLSSERAASVAIYFEEQKGIDPKKLRSIGFGKQYPIATNDTAEGREKNRRVDMIIISNESAMAKDGYLYNYLSGTFDASVYPESGGVQSILFPPQEQQDGSAATSSSSAAIEPPAQTDQPSGSTEEGEVLENVSPYE